MSLKIKRISVETVTQKTTQVPSPHGWWVLDWDTPRRDGAVTTHIHTYLTWPDIVYIDTTFISCLTFSHNYYNKIPMLHTWSKDQITFIHVDTSNLIHFFQSNHCTTITFEKMSLLIFACYQWLHAVMP